MKILIIGINGFIGSNLSRYFESMGHEVIGITAQGISRKNLFVIDKLTPEYDFIFQEHTFDVVINAAGSKGVGFSWENTVVDHTLNVLNNAKLLEAIKKSGQNPKIIHFSSAAVYGNPKQLPISEVDAVQPISPYGFHKLQAENLMLEYHELYGLQTCNLRVFSVFGPGLKKQLLWDVYQKILATRSGQISLFGTGAESRDYIYIDDLMSVIEILLDKGAFIGGVYNVANGIDIRIDEIVSNFIVALETDVAVSFNGEQKKGDPKNWRADIGRLKALGYEPGNNIHEELKEYAKWLRKGSAY